MPRKFSTTNVSLGIDILFFFLRMSVLFFQTYKRRLDIKVAPKKTTATWSNYNFQLSNHLVFIYY